MSVFSSSNHSVFSVSSQKIIDELKKLNDEEKAKSVEERAKNAEERAKNILYPMYSTTRLYI